MSIVMLAIIMLSSAVAFGAAGVKPTISINGVTDTLSVSAGQPVKIALGHSSGEHDGKEADWWLLKNSSGKWYYYNLGGSWIYLGTPPNVNALSPTYQGRLFSVEPVDLFYIPKLDAGNHAYYFGIDLKKNGLLDGDSLYYSGVQVSVSEKWYKDADDDGYSDGTTITSPVRPGNTYYTAIELIATSGDSNDNNPKIFPVGASTALTRIQTAIQTSGAQWVAESNEISALSKEEIKKRLGVIIPSDVATRAKRTYARREKLPASLDWRNNKGTFVTPVKNQGDCGSCWAFSSTAAFESQVLISTGQSKDLSEQIVVSCSGAGSCDGGSLDGPSDFFKNTGTNIETCYPYTATDGSCNNACANWRSNTFRIDSWNEVAATVSDIKNAVFTSGPVVTAFLVFEDFGSYKSGVYSYVKGKYLGGHAVLIVGWDDSQSCFIVKNSWGTGWGDSGYFKIAYSEVGGKTEFGCWTIAYTTQKASCSYTINPTDNSFVSSGGTGSVNVTAAGECTWDAVSNDTGWLTVTSGNTSNGNGTVSYSVAQYTGTVSRTGTITVAGQTFTVTQSGISCTYNINPTSNSVSSSGGAGNISVTAASGCNWNATSSANWITITSGGSGSGNGTVSYWVAANSGTSSRTGNISVAGKTFVIQQEGISCTYSINPTNKTFSSDGGTGNITVNTPSGCLWNAVSSDNSWITITSGNSGNGQGTVNYSVTPNPGSIVRNGSITVAGQTFNITQKIGTFSLYVEGWCWRMGGQPFDVYVNDNKAGSGTTSSKAYIGEFPKSSATELYAELFYYNGTTYKFSGTIDTTVIDTYTWSIRCSY